MFRQMYLQEADTHSVSNSSKLLRRKTGKNRFNEQNRLNGQNRYNDYTDQTNFTNQTDQTDQTNQTDESTITLIRPPIRLIRTPITPIIRPIRLPIRLIITPITSMITPIRLPIRLIRSPIRLIIPGLRHNRIKNTNSKIKHIQMPCLVQTEALFDEDRGLSLKE